MSQRAQSERKVLPLLIVREALLVIPPREAEMLTTIFRLTDTVVTLNVAVVLPANTVTVAGTAALLELLLDKATTKPPWAPAL